MPGSTMYRRTTIVGEVKSREPLSFGAPFLKIATHPVPDLRITFFDWASHHFPDGYVVGSLYILISNQAYSLLDEIQRGVRGKSQWPTEMALSGREPGTRFHPTAPGASP